MLITQLTTVKLHTFTQPVSSPVLLLINEVSVFSSSSISDEDAGWESTYLIPIILPVLVISVTIIAIIITFIIVLRKRRKQSEDRTHDHIYDIPEDTRSQLKYQKNTTTLHPTLYPYDMKSNVAYGFIVSDQQVCRGPYIQSDAQTGAVSKV